jgi:hypothetical protein
LAVAVAALLTVVDILLDQAEAAAAQVEHRVHLALEHQGQTDKEIMVAMLQLQALTQPVVVVEQALLVQLDLDQHQAQVVMAFYIHSLVNGEVLVDILVEVEVELPVTVIVHRLDQAD